MNNLSQIRVVTNFQDFVSTPLKGYVNAVCWKRELVGDFEEIVQKIQCTNNIVEVSEEELNELQLTEDGQVAREILLNDLKLLRELGALPVLNVIEYYERDDAFPFFPTDVYSFHVDRSPVPVDTFLCTYFGASSDILPNSEAEQKILIPEIRAQLKELYAGPEDGFDTFLSENFFDLHYQAKPSASPINLGIGNFWRLAVDCPDSNVMPCIHRAPEEKDGKKRLLMIC